jgi:hypothetical protein
MLPRPADDSLIEQQRLDRGARPGEAGREKPRVEAVAERLGAEAGEQAVRPLVAGGDQVHRPEAAHVVEGDPHAALDVEHHMVVLRGFGIGWTNSPSGLVADQHAARHAEMDHQHLAGPQIGQQILGAAAQRA